MPAKPNIVFFDAATVDLGDVSLHALQRLGALQVYARTTSTQRFARARQADVLISNKVPLDAALLAQLPRLRLICVAATGINNVDISAAKQRSIAVCNVSGYSTETVAEHTFAFLLALSHRLISNAAAVQQGRWCRSPLPFYLDAPYAELAGKTLGLIGYGAIGRRVAALAQAFRMKVLLARLPGRRYPAQPQRLALKQVLQASDFVSLHCPLTPQTERLLGAAEFAAMKPTAYLLNLARGPLVDDDALAQALRAGRLAGYASDVLSQEPPPRDHPLLAKDLRPRVLLTPHIAWASCEARQRLIQALAANIDDFYRGKKRNRIL